jgi:TolA-binding protein
MWAALIVLLMGIGGGGVYILNHQSSGPLSATLTAAPMSVEKGQSVRLSWSSQNATSLDLEPGVGRVDPEGSMLVTPNGSVTYTLTATGAGGTTQSPTAQVTVVPAQHQEQQQQQQQQTQNNNNVNTDDRAKRQREAELKRQREAELERQRQAELEAQAEQKKQHDAEMQKRNSDVNGKLTLGKFHYGRGEYDEAIAAFQEGLALDPTRADLHQWLDKTISTCKREEAVLNEGFKCGGH